MKAFFVYAEDMRHTVVAEDKEKATKLFANSTGKEPKLVEEITQPIVINSIVYYSHLNPYFRF